MSPNSQPLRGDRMRLSHGIEIALVILLLIGFCGRVWDIGITTTDDAVWALLAHQPDQHPTADFAIQQGRLWAWAGGLWVEAGLWYEGTHFADALITGSFLLFFALFVRAVAVYWSAATAFTTVAAFMAIAVLHGERTILTSYPGFFWMPASGAIAAMLAARRYQKSGSLTALIGCALLTIVGLFNNEGGTLLTLVLLPAAIVGNHLQQHAPSMQRLKTVLTVVGVLSLLFVAATLVYRWTHPSSYGGNILAPFDLRRILPTLLGFSASGTIFYDMVEPYKQTYPDFTLNIYPGITHAPRLFLTAALRSPASLTAGFLVATLLVVTGRSASGLRVRSVATGLLSGLAIATLLVLPVAMTVQYQTWFFQYGLDSYSHTIFTTFGLALMVAILLDLALQAVPRRLRLSAAVLVAIGFGGLAAVSSQMNDTIMQAARPSAGRWRVLKDLITVAHATGSEHDTLLVPRFKDEALYAFIKTPYWSDYALARYGENLRVIDKGLTARDVQNGAATADYYLMADGRSFAVTVAHLNPSGQTFPTADRITVLLEQGDPALQNQILSFTDRRQGIRQMLLRSLRPIGARMWTLDGIEADPLSIRVGLFSFEQQLRLGCGDAPAGQTLQFGIFGSSCDARGALRNGWSGAEQDGSWTNAPTAMLQLPTAGLPSGPLIVALDASGYGGMSPTDPPQTVTVTVNGHYAATMVSRAGSPAAASLFTVPGADWTPGTPLTITFDITPLYRPNPPGSAGDTRELGLYLRAITLRPAP